MLCVAGVAAKLPVVINNYEFREMIGRGAFGSVYRCLNTTYGVEFAAKVLPISSASASQSFTSEIQALLQLDHSNVIKLYKYFEFEDQLILVLELCNGGSIKTKINDGLQWDKFLHYAVQILEGISCIHGQNIAHRDIKPANLLLTDTGRVKVSDFGISAKVVGQMTDFAGSLCFVPPEMLSKNKKEYDPFAADIYALGVTFFTMITGKVPWIGTSRDEIRKQIKLGFIDLSVIEKPGLKAALKRMLAMDPRERPTIAELKQMSIFQQPLRTVHSKGHVTRPLIPGIRRNSANGLTFTTATTSTKLGGENAAAHGDKKAMGNRVCYMQATLVKPIALVKASTL